MEIVQYDKPVDRVRAFIRDYAQQLYGIDNACSLGPLVEVAFDTTERSSDRIRAASELAKYSEVPTRSIEYAGGNNGPDLVVEILGECAITEPESIYSDDARADTKRLAAETSPKATLELHDEGRDPGS